MEEIEDAKKAVGLIFVVVIMLCFFAKTAYFKKGDSEFEYQKIAGGGLIGMLLVVFVIKYI